MPRCSPKAKAAELRPLPDIRHNVAKWVYNRSVNFSLHVICADNRYSASTATWGARSICGSANPHRQSITPQSVSPPTGCCRRTRGTPIAPTKRICRKRSSSPNETTSALRAGSKCAGPGRSVVTKRIFSHNRAKGQARSPFLSVLDFSKKYSEAHLEGRAPMRH